MPLPLGVTVSTLVRMGIAIAVCLVWLPRSVWRVSPSLEGLDRTVSGAAIAMLVLVIAGYVLAAGHLFGWVGLVCALLVPWVWRLSRQEPEEPIFETLRPLERLSAALLAELDALPTLPRRLAARVPRAFRRVLFALGSVGPYNAGVFLAFAAVAAVTVWMRFDANWLHAALQTSDAYVVVVWVKMVALQHIFPSGVYPEGFHVLTAALQTLTLANAVVFVKFIGPLVGVGMTASVGYTAYRMSGRPVAALVAVLVYGTLPHLLAYDPTRQAATDSQEFGNMLVLPVLWFVTQAWRERKAWDYRVTVMVLLGLVAMVHPMAALNAGLCGIAATAGSWVTGGFHAPTLRFITTRMALVILLGTVPLGIGLAFGLHLYANSAGFLTGSLVSSAPPLTPAVWMAALGTAGLVLIRLLRRRPLAEVGEAVSALLALGFAVVVWQAPRFGFDSVLLVTRSGEFVGLTTALGLGLGVCAVLEVASAVAPEILASWGALLAGGALLVTAWLRLPPAPLASYTLDSDAFVATSVEIATRFPATEWMTVSEGIGGYALDLGQGYNLDIASFLQNASYQPAWPTYREPNGQVEPLGSQYIFLFVNRRFHVPPVAGAAQTLPRQERENSQLKQWIASWEQLHGPLRVFSQNGSLIVYEFARPQSSQQAGQLVFGG